MTYKGHIENGVVVLDEPSALPEGTSVKVEPVQALESSMERGSPRNWKGVFRNTGPVPSDADIAEMRHEAWPGT